jgi:hypothetical protein
MCCKCMENCSTIARKTPPGAVRQHPAERKGGRWRIDSKKAILRLMKIRSLALLLTLLLIPSLPAFSADQSPRSADESETSTLSFRESYDQGYFDARSMHDSRKWGTLGFGGGLFLNVLGGGLVAAIASMDTVTPSYIPDNVERMDYLRGYEERAQKINTTKALIGASIGVGVSSVLYVVVYAAIYAAAFSQLTF